VKFQEPTVGGLTGEQLSLLRYLEEQQRELEQCAFIFFPADARGPEERCDLEPVEGSRFCEDHLPEDDDYDCYVDREFE
jgi:hypothetical protein